MTRLEINGSYENIFDDPRDFAYVIEKYMGDEAKRYYESILDNFEFQLNNLKEDL